MQIVETMCDVCGKGPEVVHYSFGVSHLTYDIDLCDSCYSTHVEPFLGTIRTHGREIDRELIVAPVEPARTVVGAVLKCTLCGYEGRKWDLRNHATKEHQVGLSVALGAEVKAVCPECGFKLAATKGLARHQHAAHGKGFATKEA